MMPAPHSADDSSRATPDRVADAAADWVARRDRGLTPEEKRALAQWQSADPRHAAELARHTRAWRGLDALASDPDLAALANATMNRARRRRALHRRTAGLAATLLAAAAVAVVMLAPRRGIKPEAPAAHIGGPQEHVQVIASTLRRVPLPDGSVAELNGESRIEIDFTAVERRVRLVEGEAHFVVEKDAARPFFVMAGPVTVRAVGTAFNVRLGAAAIEVLVTEGAVQLEREPSLLATSALSPNAEARDLSAALVAGQRAVLERTPEASTPPTPVAIGQVDLAQIEKELGWQSTRLVFNNTPLTDVVEAFNRFNARRLVIGDSTLRGRTLTGSFRADNLDGFVRLLRASIDVKAEPRTPGEIVLLPVR